MRKTLAQIKKEQAEKLENPFIREDECTCSDLAECDDCIPEN